MVGPSYCGLIEFTMVHDDASGASIPPAASPPAPLQFSLATLLVATTAIAILCALAAIVPWLGPILAVLVPPAAVRAAIVLRHGPLNSTFSPSIGKLGQFFGSLMVVACALFVGGMWGALAGALSGMLLFGVPNGSRGANYPFPPITMLLGVLVGCFIMYWLLLVWTPVGPLPNRLSAREKLAVALSIGVSIVVGAIGLYFLLAQL